ncbi:MAG TPA: hypothetical protein VFU61_01150, partial [Steroidobacteraceae bacterium]|nr:hypothetical protein [Steroidobacteraceae bacterium]
MPSRQRAHALRLAHAAAQLACGKTAWPSPDTLPLEGWLTREVERYAGGTDGEGGPRSLPRLLSPAEEWLLWRQCTAQITDGFALVNRASLAESLRRASGLAAELRIDLQAIRQPPETEEGLLAAVHRAFSGRCEALGVAPLAAVLSGLPWLGDRRPVVFAGFLAPSPRLKSLLGARAQGGLEASCLAAADSVRLARPQVVRPADEREELERIAEWCQQRLTAEADARLLILLPGSAGRRERLAALIRQSVGAAGERSSLIALEGGQPLASLPLIAHALATLALLAGEGLGVESFLEWLRAPWWLEPGQAARARIDLWVRERRRLRLDLASFLTALRHAPAPIVSASAAIVVRLEQAGVPLGASSGTPREWSERVRAALEVLGWP